MDLYGNTASASTRSRFSTLPLLTALPVRERKPSSASTCTIPRMLVQLLHPGAGYATRPASAHRMFQTVP